MTPDPAVAQAARDYIAATGSTAAAAHGLGVSESTLLRVAAGAAVQRGTLALLARGVHLAISTTGRALA